MPQNYQRKKSSPVSMNESQSFTSSSCHKKLQQYLDTFLNHPEKYTFPRVQCCSNSTASSDTPASTDTANTAPPTSSRRALYCTDCSKLLIPHDQWPPSIQNGQLDLPFSLDILLSDRRRSSTGFHALVLYHATSSSSSRSQGVIDNRRRMNSTQAISKDEDKVQLFDLERGDALPNYHHCAQPQDEQQNQGRQQQQQEGGTYVLFPSSTSMPLSSVAENIHRLIVLDCKWTKSTSHEKLSAISSLPKVHLDHAPNESFYWRWHNAGPGMISTMEAVYFAAWEVTNAKRRREEEGGEEEGEGEEKESLDVLLDWMWLFGIQRAATAQGALQRGKPAPFTLKGKEVQRELRRTEKGSEKHLRDIEQGKRLKEEYQRMVQDERNNQKRECVQDI